MTIDQIDLDAREAAPSALVSVGIDLNPPRQRRLSVFLRGLLVFPLALTVALLAIPVYVVVIIAWFAALFTGRVPDSLHEFMTGFERLNANVSAYQFLLVPKWPGLNFSPRLDEQVSIEIANLKQRRLSIFFRGLLIVPASFVAALWNVAHALFAFVMWVWVLIKGRAPRSLHHYSALWLRYSIRLGAFGLLLTSAQPWHGLHGDGIDESPRPTSFEDVPEERRAASADGAPDGLAPSSLGQYAPVGVVASLYAEGPDTSLATTWLVVPRARRLVNWSFPLGGLLVIVYIVVIVSFVATKVSQVLQVTNSYDTHYAAGRAFLTSAQTCTTVTCINDAALLAMREEVRAIGYLSGGFSGPALNAYAVYRHDLTKMTADYLSFSVATSKAQVQAVAPRWNADFVQTRTDALALTRLIP